MGRALGCFFLKERERPMLKVAARVGTVLPECTLFMRRQLEKRAKETTKVRAGYEFEVGRLLAYLKSVGADVPAEEVFV